ncbi:MAG: BatA domain-containing protein [Oligosphaeraceae bacterium]
MLSFLHPELLWLLPLAAAPLLIHLLGNPAPPPLDFPGLRFLRATPVPIRGRRHWRDLLLMLLRTLLLAATILLAAAPVWIPKDEPAPPSPEAAGGQAVLLDASASMQATMGQLMPGLLGLQGAHIAYWEVGAEARQIPSPAGWSCGWSGAMAIPQALQQASRWLVKFPPGQRTLHIFSDLQSCDWGRNLGKIPPNTRLRLHTPARLVQENCGILQTAVASAPQGQLRVQVRCRNWGDASSIRDVVLTADGKETRVRLTLPPKGELSTSFLIPAPGNPQGTLQLLPQDDFAFDDKRIFWVKPAPPNPLLAIFSDEPEDTRLSQELEFFCVPALTAEPPESSPAFLLHPLGTSGAPFSPWENLPAILLLGSAERLAPPELQRLRSYVEAGGVLLVVPGNAPLTGWRHLQSVELAPEGAAQETHRQTGIAELPPGSPLEKLFPRQASSDLHLFPIRRSLQIETRPGDAQVLLSTLEGAPALLQKPLGKGQCLLFTFGFHTAASDFPLTKAFLPILREILEQALGGHSSILQIPCGEIPLPRKDLLGKMVLPDFTTEEPGLHQLGGQLVEVIPSPAESLPLYLPPEEVQRMLASAATEGAEPPRDGQELRRRPLLRGGGLLVALLFLLEGLWVCLKTRRAHAPGHPLPPP